MSAMVRKHFILPRELAEQFEREAGARGQSERVAEALELWLRRKRLADVVATFAGFASAAEHPHWATAEDVSEWVRAERAAWPDRWAQIADSSEARDG